MTERHRQRDEVFRLLVDSVTEYAIFVVDPGGKVTTWNEGAARITGYSEEEILGRLFSIFFPAADAARGKPADELRIALESGRFAEEGWRVRKDGERFWASVVMTPLRSETGEPIGFAKVVRDLTDRRRAEDERQELLDREHQALRTTERALAQLRAIHSLTETALAHVAFDDLLSALLQRVKELLTVDTAAVLLLADGGDVLVARAASGIEEEVERGVRIPLGSGFAGRIASERRPIVLDDIGHADVLNPILLEKGIRSLAGVPLLVDHRVMGVMHVGTLRPRTFSADDVRFLQVVGDQVAIAIDRSRLFEAARAARHQAVTAEEMVKARDEFLQIAAHELKTPMTGAKAAVQLLARSFGNKGTLDKTQRRSLGLVERQIDRLAQLVAELLETARAQAGMLHFDPQRTNVTDLVRDLAEEAQTGTTRHTIKIKAADRLFANLDAFRFEQVVRNLLDNAIKYSPDGGDVEVRVDRGPGRNFQLTVRDHGLGVAPEHRTRLFDRFYQAHPNRSGMGLGLYITRQIVEGHGGTIFAEFPSDGGTRFVVSVPLERATLSEPKRLRSA